jgi:hypothetical protein
MGRIRELITIVRQAHPNDKFFENFDESCRMNESKRRHYRTYDEALRYLDVKSWKILKEKAVKHFRNHRIGQLKQGFFNQLNEAFAYRYLFRRGYSEVRMLPESAVSTPDISYLQAGVLKHCEVKTIGISDKEIKDRGSGRARYLNYAELEDGFFNKFESAFQVARRQIARQTTEGLVFFVVLWDDLAVDYYPEYRQTIVSYCHTHKIHNVYFKFGLRYNRRLQIR